MPTKARGVYDEGVYHIVQRGNNRQLLFKKENDFKQFLSLIRRYLPKYHFEIYHYCLMSNHIHLVIKIFRGIELSKVMQGILQSYRFYYKSRYDYSGYLYQGRYRSKVIEMDHYLLDCGRYVERNPLRAGIIKDLSEYKWSSYNFYVSGYKNDIITKNPLYDELGKDTHARQGEYRNYILTTRLYEEIIDNEFKIKQ